MPSKVQAFCQEGKWHDLPVEDDVTAYFEFPKGATGVFVTSTGDAPGTNRLEISLEKAQILCENGKVMICELEVNERDSCRESPGRICKAQRNLAGGKAPGRKKCLCQNAGEFCGSLLKGHPSQLPEKKDVLAYTWQTVCICPPGKKNWWIFPMRQRSSNGHFGNGAKERMRDIDLSSGKRSCPLSDSILQTDRLEKT